MTTVMGIDVSARRGLDVVVLDESGMFHHEKVAQPNELHGLLDRYQPEAVAIDAPPCFAPVGQRSRASERALARLGIRSYASPDEHTARGNAFYDWMHVGVACFEAVAAAGYPIYRGEPSIAGRAVEMFPHAVTVVILGAIPALADKRVARREVLDRMGIDAGARATQDVIDAALAAGGARLALLGPFTALGDAAEGMLVLPCAAEALPTRFSRVPPRATSV